MLRVPADLWVHGLNSKVGTVEDRGAGVRIETERGPLDVGHVILATGPWLPQLAPGSIAPHVRVHRQTLHWFPVLDDSAYRQGATPTFVWTHGFSSREQFYGFPPVDGMVKVAAEQYATAFDPDELDRQVGEEETRAMAIDHVVGRLAGVAPLPASSKACLYTVTPDCDFLIADESRNIQSVSACSGHGFKHAPAIGEAVAARSIGAQPLIALDHFSGERFSVTC